MLTQPCGEYHITGDRFGCTYSPHPAEALAGCGKTVLEPIIPSATKNPVFGIKQMPRILRRLRTLRMTSAGLFPQPARRVSQLPDRRLGSLSFAVAQPGCLLSHAERAELWATDRIVPLTWARLVSNIGK